MAAIKRFRIGYLGQPMHASFEQAVQCDPPLDASYGAGYDTVDLDACTRAGVAAVNQGGGNAEGVAEHTLGMMLALLKRIPETHAALKAGRATDRDAFMGRE